MSNKEIASLFREMGELMELHGENPFRTRSYQNAYMALRKWDEPLMDMTMEQTAGIKGIGEKLAGKIGEVKKTGSFADLDGFRQKTPDGVREMLTIKGFGPKKVWQVWQELDITSPGELWYACNENRLVEAKGFGEKTQATLKKAAAYFLSSKGKFHLATLWDKASLLIETWQQAFPDKPVALTGAMARHENTVTAIELVVAESDIAVLEQTFGVSLQIVQEHQFQGHTEEAYLLTLYTCNKAEFGSKLFRYTASQEFLNAWIKKFPEMSFKNMEDEKAIFNHAAVPFLSSELRGTSYFLEQGIRPTLIEENDIRGIVHNHSTWSDGIHTLEEMANYVRSLGYAYFVISDHSQSAFYANGLKQDRVEAQWAEIEKLNQQWTDFVIYKGIESDILADGRLDYSDDVLAGFDVVIASVHSHLNMDLEKAMGRILKAIENPYTKILGHPTGRLLLSRVGYPLDMLKVIDACAANGVAIELNANPYRLDLDATWIPAAMEKGVLISINPDAHSMAGVHDIQWGVKSARSGGLTANACLNSLDRQGFASKMGIK